MHILMVTWA